MTSAPEPTSLTIPLGGDNVDPPAGEAPPTDPPTDPPADPPVDPTTVIEVSPTDPPADPAVETQADGTEWPDHVPEWGRKKYTSVDEFQKGMDNMHSENGKMAQEIAALKKGDPPTDPTDPPADSTTQVTTLLDSLSESFQANGTLTAEDFTALEKIGIPKAMAEQYVAGAEALVAQQRSVILSAAGGEAEYGSMMEWAATNVSETQRAAFDKAVTGPDVEIAALAVEGLAAKWRAGTGQGATPAELNRDRLLGNRSSGSLGFKSESEQTAAINDPRYGEDTAYTAEVQARIVKSNF